VVATMNAFALPGIAFQAVTVPVADTAAKFPGQSIPAVRLTVTDRQAYRPVRTALLLIDTIRKQHPGDFAWGPSIDALTGSDRVRQAIDADRLAPLLADWDRAAAQFRASRAGYLLYS
jgi:uncharacterized protein YbbC (DUF1343 family)